MTPDQFLDQLQKKGPQPAYLFIGPESYNRDRCRRALIAKALGDEDRDGGFTKHDLDEIPLAAAMDDARSLSLFASKRVIWLARAEAALPRGKTVSEDEGSSVGDADALTSYLREPTPDVVLVVDSARFEFD